MNTKAEKAQLTREINALKSYIQDLEECVQEQGKKHFKTVANVEITRWMLLGEYFFPSTISSEKKHLEKLQAKREAMDAVKQTSVGIESVNKKIKEVQAFFKSEIEAGRFKIEHVGGDTIYIECNLNIFGFWERGDRMEEFLSRNTSVKLDMTEDELKALHGVFKKSFLNDKKQEEIEQLEARLKALKDGE